ncbi:MAG: MBOAT family protein [Leptonema sp. (in: Bacteria)]|nr:MBOAT family protein [Leptonema sp. (in: bacteria)]
MRFTTFGFLIFFILVYIIYWLLRGRSRLAFLAVASSVFYAAWSIPFFLHFAGLVILNYFFVTLLRKKRSQFTLSIILTIDFANLFFFKYFYFFCEILFDITGFSGFQASAINHDLQHSFGIDAIILPLAISFYTFQIVAYVVDVYRNQIERKDTILEFYVFILFFPQLVAGPIMRHSNFFHQLDNILPKQQYLIRGASLLLIGLIKKVLVADNLAAVVHPVYQNPELYTGISSAVAVIGYTAQVYSDFSGYTDLARGMGLMLGLELPENFAGPFFSRTVSEFWRRWHITLSTWLRDYIYIPLGGSRTSQTRSNFNLLLTFVAGGLWHGANYTFFVWGFTAGLLLMIERIITKQTQIPQKLKKWRENKLSRFLIDSLGVLYSYFAFVFGAAFFNAPNVSHTATMAKRFFSNSTTGSQADTGMILGLTVTSFGFN